MQGFEVRGQPLLVDYASLHYARPDLEEEEGGEDAGGCGNGRCIRDTESEEEQDAEEKSVHGSVY